MMYSNDDTAKRKFQFPLGLKSFKFPSPDAYAPIIDFIRQRYGMIPALIAKL